MKISLMLCLGLCTLFSLSCTSDSQPVYATGVKVQKWHEAQIAADAFRGVNGLRAEKGLAPLQRVRTLDKLAATHNVAMNRQASPYELPIPISHDGGNERAQKTFALGHTSYGENVAGIRGFTSHEAGPRITKGWKNSTSHYKTLMSRYTYTGIAVFVNESDGTIYATQLFAN